MATTPATPQPAHRFEPHPGAGAPSPEAPQRVASTWRALPLRAAQQRADQLPQRLPQPRVGHPGRDGRAGHPEAAARVVLSGLAAGTPTAGRTGPGQCRGHLLPARRLDPSGRQAGRAARHHRHLQKPGLSYGQNPGRAGGSVPHPRAGRRAVCVRVAGRVDAEGPRRRPDRQRARPGRHRGQRQRPAGDPRPGRHLTGGRCRLAGVPARPGRPRPIRGPVDSKGSWPRADGNWPSRR
jgi:hypothetical protein